MNDKPTREQIEINRLRKQLKRTQERAARLQLECGDRFLKSRAAHFLSLYTTETALHAASRRKILELERALGEAKRQTASETLASIEKLIASVKRNC